jgi:ribosomal protein L39E
MSAHKTFHIEVNLDKKLKQNRTVSQWILMRATREYETGKYHCTIDLLFGRSGLVSFANKNKNCQLSYSWFQTSQTGGQRYNDTAPFSIPWVSVVVIRNSANRWDLFQAAILKFIYNIIMHADWLTEWGMLRACPHFLLAHTLFTGKKEREREIKRETKIEREGEREREREKERDRKREGGREREGEKERGRGRERGR